MAPEGYRQSAAGHGCRLSEGEALSSGLSAEVGGEAAAPCPPNTRSAETPLRNGAPVTGRGRMLALTPQCPPCVLVSHHQSVTNPSPRSTAEPARGLRVLPDTAAQQAAGGGGCGSGR